MREVLSTELHAVVALQLLRTSEDKPLNGRPLWERSDLDAGQLANEFQRECHVVRRSIDGDLVKVVHIVFIFCTCCPLLLYRTLCIAYPFILAGATSLNIIVACCCQQAAIFA